MSKSILFYTLVVGCMALSGGIASGENVLSLPDKTLNPSIGTLYKAELPQTVKTFLQSRQGKGFTEDDFRRTLEAQQVQGSRTADVELTDPEEILVVEESFGLWTAGADGAPDATDISGNLDSYMSLPGWSGLSVFQAGGTAFLGMYEDPEDGDSPGYLMTPDLDLTANDGMFLVRLRVKSEVPEQNIQFFCLDNGGMGIVGADAVPVSQEWETREIIFAGGKSQTAIMFYGTITGNIYVDDVQIYSLDYGISKPVINSAMLTSRSSIEINWNAVEGATSYLVSLYSSDPVDLAQEETVVNLHDTGSAETTFVLSGYPIDPSLDYLVEVRAKDAEHVSTNSSWVSVEIPAEIPAPVALDATGISENGFTANWEEVGLAWNYTLTVEQEKVAQEGEEYTYIDEDFSGFTEGSMTGDTGPAVVAMYYDLLDGYMSQDGWVASLGCSAGIGAFITTNLYDAEGIPGFLMSPESDFSLGGGKVHVEFDAQTLLGNDIVLLVGFVGEDNNVDVLQSELVEVGATSTHASVDLSGGVDGGKLLIYFWDGELDMVTIDNLKVTMVLEQGDNYRLLVAHEILAGTETSSDVALTEGGNYVYSLRASYPYHAAPLVSDQSNEVRVEVPMSGITDVTADATVRVDEGRVYVSNPRHALVHVFAVSGQFVGGDDSGHDEVVIALPSPGVYIISVGTHVFKVIW